MHTRRFSSRNPKALALLATLTGLAGLATLAVRAAAPAAPAVVDSPTADEQSVPARFAPGFEYRYDLDFDASQVQPALAFGPNASPEGRFTLSAELAFRTIDARTLRVAVGAVESASARLGEAPLPVSPADFAGLSATLRLGPDGALEAVSFSGADKPLGAQLLKAVVAELQLPMGETRCGQERTESLANGRAETRFDCEGRNHWRRSRTAYSAIDWPGVSPDAVTTSGEVTLDVDDAGLPLRLAGESDVVGPVPPSPGRGAEGREAPVPADSTPRTTTTVALTLRETRRVTGEFERNGAPFVAVDALLPEAAAPTDWARSAEGLTPAALLELVRRGIGNHDLWRAVSLLRAEPEVAELLRDAYPGLPASERNLAVDLLTRADTAEARAALRNVLDMPATLEDQDAGLLVQRIGLVVNPDAETLAWAQHHFDHATPALRAERALSLGAVAGRALRAGLPAQEALDELLAMTAADRPTADRVLGLEALGNAGVPATAAEILPALTDGSPAVRAAAVTGLRRIEEPAVRLRLAEAAGDESRDVKLAALSALSTGAVPETVWPELIARLAAGALAEPWVQMQLLELATRHLATAPGARALVQALAAARPVAPEVLARAMQLLEST